MSSDGNIQSSIKNEKEEPPKMAQEEAVKRIIRGWRYYTNRKIYKYYRDLILFRKKGKPHQLLKAINPAESKLMDHASNAHIRFRLGGETFPPNIYYKIFLHGSLCDVNSFAPRDYAKMRQPNEVPTQKMSYAQYKTVEKQKAAHDGWYLRMDNNGWRQINQKIPNKADFVEIFTANKVKYFHHNKQKREEKSIKKKRMNKLRWLQKMYARGVRDEEIKEGGEGQEIEEGKQEDITAKVGDTNPFFDEKFLDMDENEFDNEVKDLIEWSENLDFDKYMKDWFILSTSDGDSLESKMSVQNMGSKQIKEITLNTDTLQYSVSPMK